MNAPRAPGEDFASYRRRMRWAEKALRERLRRAQPAEGYKPGPHKTHRPRIIEAIEVVAGARINRSVQHPGTLVRTD